MAWIVRLTGNEITGHQGAGREIDGPTRRKKRVLHCWTAAMVGTIWCRVES